MTSFILSLLNDAVRSADGTESDDKIINNELENMHSMLKYYPKICLEGETHSR
jgi:hypothetical protein